MKVIHSPVLELHFTEQSDYDLVLYSAIDYTHRKVKRKTQKLLENIDAGLLVAQMCILQVTDTARDEMLEPYRLVHDDAHLAIMAIDTFVEGTFADHHASSEQLQIARYGKQILEMVRADIPD